MVVHRWKLEAGAHYGVCGAVGPDSRLVRAARAATRPTQDPFRKTLTRPANAQSNRERPSHGTETGSVEEDIDTPGTDHNASNNKERPLERAGNRNAL